ncbi:MAG: hypothetical protein WCP35_15950, partial [Verrucomicrobiota bacterium]
EEKGQRMGRNKNPFAGKQRLGGTPKPPKRRKRPKPKPDASKRIRESATRKPASSRNRGNSLIASRA